MTDKVFIQERIERGKQAKEKAQREFTGISVAQLNWKSSPESWSMAQCLNHLITADSLYFPVFKKIAEGNYHMTFWEKHSPFSRIMGNIMKRTLRETVGRKWKAPKKFHPDSTEFTLDILDQYQKNVDVLLGYIAKCENIDIDGTVITSPVNSLVTYNLRDTFFFLTEHEHRHINQGTRVKSSLRFPKQ